MSRFLKGIFGQTGSTESAVAERQLLESDSDTPAHRLARDVRNELDAIIAFFTPAENLMAEVMMCVPDTHDIITWELRPSTSVGQYFRLREGEGIAGKVFKSGTSFAGAVTPQDQTSNLVSAPDDIAHLLSSRSVAVIPLMAEGRRLGVLNIESPDATLLNQDQAKRLLDSGLVEKVQGTLALITPERLSADTLIEDVIDKLGEKIAFAINPDDMTDTYYQILRVSAQIVSPTSVSGGLILKRDKLQRLASETTSGELFAVRAARIGAFDSVREWDASHQSIARRVMDNKRGERIGNARADPDYRDSGTGEQDTSELIVPLVSGNLSIGVIGLVTPGLDKFTEDDLAHLKTVADIAVYAVQRSEELRTNRRRRDQLAFSRLLLDKLAPLFPREAPGVTLEDISRVRDAVSTAILTHTRDKTGSEHATFVQAERNELGEDYLVIHEYQSPDPVAQNVPSRWRAKEGVTGRAYSDNQTTYQSHVTTSRDPNNINYIPYFKDGQSEVATPLRVGDRILGVLDAESKQPEHFTSDHIEWMEFLAAQAAFALATIEGAMKAHTEVTLGELSSSVDGAIERMRKIALESHAGREHKVRDLRAAMRAVRNARNDEMLKLIQSLLPLTHSWVGRFLIALNAYDGASINARRGQMFILVSTEAHELVTNEDRFFSLTRGASSQAFVERRPIIFNDRGHLPDGYFEPEEPTKSKSGIFYPVAEGAQTSGVLNIESAYEGSFTPDIVRVCQIACDLASKLVSAARLQITTLLREQLRRYTFQILGQHSADMTEFMQAMLRRSAALSDIDEGWGKIVFVRLPGAADQPISDSRYWMNYRGADANADFGADDTPTPITDSVIKEAIAKLRPVLILDRSKDPAGERQGSVWPDEANSVIAVPLLRPREIDSSEQRDGSASSLDAIGVLALAHRNLAEFSEYDKEMLALLAEVIVTGLNNIALLRETKEVMEQVRRSIIRALDPLSFTLDAARDTLQALQEATDPESARQRIDDMVKTNTQIGQLTRLVGDLTNWYLDLANDDLDPMDNIEAVTPQSVAEQLLPSIRLLAGVYYERVIDWTPPATTMAIQGGEDRIRLIQAALFQYFDNGFKHSEEDAPIDFSIAVEGPYAVFKVGSVSAPIPVEDRERIFQRSYQPSDTLQSSDALESLLEAPHRSAVGLFQTREIAARLGGKAYYEADQSQATHHVFCLALPIVSPSGQ